MIKKTVFGMATILLLLGCNSTSSSDEDNSDATTAGVGLWNYLVPNKSVTLSFDKIKTVNSETLSTELDVFSHEYAFISDSEVTGSWRDYEGEYSYKIESNQIVYALVEDSPDYDSAFGRIRTNIDIGDSPYTSNGSSGITNFSGGIKTSRTVSGKECVLSKIYGSIELYSGYAYNDVLELTCEDEHDQEYGDVDAPKKLLGIDRYYEYYQKDIGWIGQVNKTCIVAIVDRYEFIDDNNGTCVKTTAEYQLRSI